MLHLRFGHRTSTTVSPTTLPLTAISRHVAAHRRYEDSLRRWKYSPRWYNPRTVNAPHRMNPLATSRSLVACAALKDPNWIGVQILPWSG